MEIIDLHTHSTCSDGTLSPEELVDHAIDRGLAAIALTDHDTVEGLDAALARAAARGFELVPGVEVSARHGELALHILGYGVRHHDQALRQGLARLQEMRQQRNAAIVERLGELGIAISLDELQSAGGQVGRPHIARLLVARGLAGSMNAAFGRFLRRGAAAYVESAKLTAIEVIRLIGAAGGVAVLAHPATVDPTLAALPGLVAELKPVGLAGLELYYPTHSRRTRNLIERLGREHGLLFTGGSDFHGAIRPWAPIGGPHHTPRPPAALLGPLREAIAATADTRPPAKPLLTKPARRR